MASVGGNIVSLPSFSEYYCSSQYLPKIVTNLPDREYLCDRGRENVALIDICGSNVREAHDQRVEGLRHAGSRNAWDACELQQFV